MKAITCNTVNKQTTYSAKWLDNYAKAIAKEQKAKLTDWEITIFNGGNYASLLVWLKRKDGTEFSHNCAI